MVDAITFFVPGEPRGKQRARAGQGRHYTPAETVAAERAITWAAKVAMGNRRPLEGPVRLDIRAAFSFPASWSKKRKDETFWKVSKCDRDNIEKLAADALKGVVWIDDAQVCCGEVCKFYAAAPGLAITVRPATDEDRPR